MPRLCTWQVWTCVWREEWPATGSVLEALSGRKEVQLFPAAPRHTAVFIVSFWSGCLITLTASAPASLQSKDQSKGNRTWSLLQPERSGAQRISGPVGS